MSVGSQGRYLARPEFVNFSNARDPSNNTTLSSAVVTGDSSLALTTQNGLSFTLPWSRDTAVALTSANTSSTFGPLSGWGLISPAGDFYAYAFAPDSDPTKTSRVFGGTPTPTNALPTSGYGAHLLVTLDSPTFISATPFAPPAPSTSAAVFGAFSSPLLSVYSPNAHMGAIAGSPDPNQRAVAMQASLGIVGQGPSQSSYVGLMLGTYITDYTKPDAMVLSGSYQGSLRASATDRTTRFSSAASTMETQSGTAIYGPNGDYMVIGPDSVLTSGVNNSVRTQAAAVTVAHDTLATPVGSYYPLSIALPLSPPSGIGDRRTTQTMNGYAAGNVEARTISSGAFSEFSVRNVDPMDVTIGTNASSNRAQATLRVARTDDPARDLTVQLGSLSGNHRSASAFVNDTTFGLIQNPNVGTTYDGTNPATGRLFAVTHATVPVTNVLPPGVAFCSCEYLSWGYWAGEVSYASGPRAGQVDRMHLGTWVAGTKLSENDILNRMPTSGTATYSGHIIGNVTNGNNRYLAAGGFQHGWNFGTRSGTVNITSFDGTNYTGASSGPPSSANFAATISGPGGVRTGSMNGSFFKSPEDVVKYQGGSFGITGPNYGASGIFAGQR